MSGTPDFQVLENESPFPRTSWECDFQFNSLEKTIEQWTTDYKLDLEPDFQRAHVWTDAQRSAFVEYIIGGGPHGRTLYFACRNWSRLLDTDPLVIVDGKQRLEAVRRFMRGELKVRGHYVSEWTGVLRYTTGGSFRFCIADIDRVATLRWYLALNTAGTPHTAAEIKHVQRLLKKETAK